MPLPPPWESVCELKPLPAQIGLQEWRFSRRFRVITLESLPPLGPIVVTSAPGIPPFGSAYIDFASNELVPSAILVNYGTEIEGGNPREWVVTCEYSTQQNQPVNSGGLQSPPSPRSPSGGGGSSPDDPTQFLPKVSVGAEIIRIPYRFDPQFNNVDQGGRFTDANRNTIAGGFPIGKYANTTGESFAAGASYEIALETYRVALYRTDYVSYNDINNCVNSIPWDGFDSRTVLVKPVNQSRERFGLSWYWLHSFDLVYDPYFMHTFTVLNAGFRELTNPLGPLQVGVRNLRDITNAGVRTSVEWPLNASGQKITDPGANGANLIYAEFNKHPSQDFLTRLPFLLSDYGII